MHSQPELPLSPEVAAPIGAMEVDWFIGELRTRDWATAEELLKGWRLPVTEQAKRRLRALAESSAGQVCSGDRGYKLTVNMTAEEFGHFDRRLASQEARMKERRLASQRVFYALTNVHRVPMPKA